MQGKIVKPLQENMFLQYFLGYTSFTNEAPFSPSLFVEIRERLSIDIVTTINNIVVAHQLEIQDNHLPKSNNKNEDKEENNTNDTSSKTSIKSIDRENAEIKSDTENPSTATPQNKGRLIVDATVAPQNITYPTDLKLLNAAREKSEEWIDKLYKKLSSLNIEKPRTYRQIAHKDFLNTAKKKAKTYKEIYKANGTQIRYLKRNLNSMVTLLTLCTDNNIDHQLKPRDIEYIEVMNKIYEQQNEMHMQKKCSVENRVVNLHQHYVRPMVRGKEGKKVEFGSKLQVSLVKGFAFLDKLSWNNFNEGKYLLETVEKYKQRFGFYPAEILADQIYCKRENRKRLKELNIKLLDKPLGRPSIEAQSNLVSPGERNPIEGKFGQAKVVYGLANTSEIKSCPTYVVFQKKCNCSYYSTIVLAIAIPCFSASNNCNRDSIASISFNKTK